MADDARPRDRRRRAVRARGRDLRAARRAATRSCSRAASSSARSPQYPTYVTLLLDRGEAVARRTCRSSSPTEKPTRRDALAYYRAVVRHFELPRAPVRARDARSSGATARLRRAHRGRGRARARRRARERGRRRDGLLRLAEPPRRARRGSAARHARLPRRARGVRPGRRSSSAAATRRPRRRSICGAPARA